MAPLLIFLVFKLLSSNIRLAFTLISLTYYFPPHIIHVITSYYFFFFFFFHQPCVFCLRSFSHNESKLSPGVQITTSSQKAPGIFPPNYTNLLDHFVFGVPAGHPNTRWPSHHYKRLSFTTYVLLLKLDTRRTPAPVESATGL